MAVRASTPDRPFSCGTCGCVGQLSVREPVPWEYPQVKAMIRRQQATGHSRATQATKSTVVSGPFHDRLIKHADWTPCIPIPRPPAP